MAAWRLTCQLPMIFTLAVGLILASAPSANAVTAYAGAPTGEIGWCTVTGPGTTACFATANEACYDQFLIYANGGTYQGIRDTANWFTKGCRWIRGPNGSYGATVDFYCDTSTWDHTTGLDYWNKTLPGRCVYEGQNYPKTCPTCGTANPIDVLSGGKTFKAEDFATIDGGLSLARTYHTAPDGPNNNDVFSATLGLANWAFDFDYELQIGSDWDINSTLGVLAPGGGLYKFQRNSTTGAMAPFTNSHEPLPQVDYTLALDGAWPSSLSTIRNATTKWILTDAQSRVWHLQTFVDPASGKYQIARPTSMVEPSGRTLTFAYNSLYELTSITDSDGKQITFDWIDDGTIAYAIKTAHLPNGDKVNYYYDQISPNGLTVDRLARIEHVDSSNTLLDKTSYLYGNSQWPTYITDIQDKTGVTRWSVTYDGRGRALTSSGPGGVDQASVTYGTDTASFSPTVTNALGKVTTYNFTRSGLDTYDLKLNSISTAATTNTPATTRSITYGTDHFVATVTDEEARVTAYTNNARGLPTQIVEAQGTASARTTTITWHATLNLPTQVVQPGLTTDYVYNTAGQLTSKTETDTTTISTPYATNGRTRTWTYTYATDGQVLTVDGPLPGTGDTVTYGYNASGFLSSVTDEVGHVTTVSAWDPHGLPMTVVDPNGVTTTFTYDVQGRPLTATVNPGAAQSQYAFQYTAMGDVSQITLPRGGYLQYTYNSARQLTQVTNDRGQTRTLTPNLMSEPTSVTTADAGSSTTAQQSFAYDELGRTIRAIGAGSQTWAFAYDKVDNLKTVTDAKSKASQTAFDPLNRAITLTDPESHTVQLGYAANDNFNDFKDGRALETTRVVDGFGRTIQETSPDRGTRTYYYDLASHLTEVIDGDGQETDYAYDSAGRLQTATYVGHTAENITYAYDATAGGNAGVGRLTGVTDQSGSTAFTYDAQGRVITDAKTIQSKSYSVQYAYDANGKVTGITLPSGRTITYTRAADGLVSAIATTPAGGSAQTVASSITYLPFGPLKGLTYGNGLSLTQTYDANYWLSQTQVTGGMGVSRLDLSFARDANGRLTGVTDNISSGRGATFGYTDAGRLNAATGPWGTDAYTYDAAGNRTDFARTVGGTTTHATPILASTSNQVTQIHDGTGATVRSFTYRTGGDLSQDAQGVSVLYSYNARKRVVDVNTAGVDTAQYGYDFRGQRVWKADLPASTTAHYVFDEAGHLLAEHNGVSGAVLREYVWLDDTPIAMIDSTGSSPAIYFIHSGQLGEPQMMTDASQAKVWDAYVEPFGAAQTFTTATANLGIRLPGQFADSELGFSASQNRHRDYDTSLGRYIEADPVGLSAGQNLYGYVDGDPFYLIDPTGLTKVILFSPTEDAAMYRSALADADNPNQCIVYAHGNSRDITDQRNGKSEEKLHRWFSRDADAFNDFLNSKPQGCKPYQLVVLKSCDTGGANPNGAPPFAQALANARRNLVSAPDKSVWFEPTGPNATPYGHLGGDVHNPINPSDPGRYILFLPQ